MSNKTTASGLGPFGSMLEGVDLLKKAWSNFAIPGAIAPPMDLEELDKRIADLKTVEQWLNMNLSMLRGTIQGLEVQRGTVATVKALGDALAGSGNPAAEAMANNPLAAMASAGVNPNAWWNVLQGQFTQIAEAAARGAPPVGIGAMGAMFPNTAKDAAAAGKNAGKGPARTRETGSKRGANPTRRGGGKASAAASAAASRASRRYGTHPQN